MTYLYLYLGLALFFGIHLAQAIAATRHMMSEKLGDGPRKGVIALISFLGLGLMIYGYQVAPFDPVYEPLSSARGIAHAVMPLAFIAITGAHAPSNFKRYLRHPMSIAVLAWALTHLSANGDWASVLLFGGFALFTLMDIFVTGRPGPTPPARPRVNDMIAIVVGMVLYGAVVWAHGAVFGVPVTG